MFFHVLFLFPETSQKPLEEVDEIFDDSTPGSFKYLGTPAWKTKVDTRTRKYERGEFDEEEKLGRRGPSPEENGGETRVENEGKTEEAQTAPVTTTTQ